MRLKRERAGHSQQDTASKMGITNSYLCDLENGRREWDYDLFKRFNAAIK